jgi:hypothetical protein
MLVQVGEGIHRVTGGVTNFYLISESGKFTVVDAGTPRDWGLLESSLKELGAGRTPHPVAPHKRHVSRHSTFPQTPPP